MRLAGAQSRQAGGDDGFGRWKSGSPTSRWMMSRPAACMALARARMSITRNGSMSSSRRALACTGPASDQMLVDELAHEVFGLGAVEAVDDLAVLVEQHRRETAGAVLPAIFMLSPSSTSTLASFTLPS
jgi:hypothetical protein